MKETPTALYTYGVCKKDIYLRKCVRLATALCFVRTALDLWAVWLSGERERMQALSIQYLLSVVRRVRGISLAGHV